MSIKLRAANKQTVDGETEHNKKKMKMFSERKPESFVLMRSNCCCDSHSTTRRESCKKHHTSMKAAIVVVVVVAVVVVVRRHGVQRARGGAMTSSFWKVCRFAVHTRAGGLRFRICPP